jgi:hypothetical protein
LVFVFDNLEKSLNGLIINEYLNVWQASLGEACGHTTLHANMLLEVPEHD